MKRRILVIDDESSIRDFLSLMLSKENYEVETADCGETGIKLFEQSPFQAVITDGKMPGMSGMEVLQAVKKISPDTAVIMITAYGSTETAVEAMKLGASDYITKPFKIDEMKVILSHALKHQNLEVENRQLKSQLQNIHSFGNLIGSSPAMFKIKDLIRKVSGIKANVFITGESGTGKELIARAIHYNSHLKDKPFIAINCGALPENLLESELFGHQKGAFTGAISNKIGLFLAASGGTLFLDEVGEMPLNLQVKLLRSIQERTIRPVGATKDISIDVRIIAATNRNLETEMTEGNFREDLYYRLNVIQIHSAPLRERMEDLAELTQYFLQKHSKEMKKGVLPLSETVNNLLCRYHFPGNIRELENILERAVALETSEEITPSSLPPQIVQILNTPLPANVTPLHGGGGGSAPSHALGIQKEVESKAFEPGFKLDDLVGKIERDLLLKALDQSRGVKTKAAEILGISFRSMRYRCKKYGIKLDDEAATG